MLKVITELIYDANIAEFKTDECCKNYEFETTNDCHKFFERYVEEKIIPIIKETLNILIPNNFITQIDIAADIDSGSAIVNIKFNINDVERTIYYLLIHSLKDELLKDKRKPYLSIFVDNKKIV